MRTNTDRRGFLSAVGLTAAAAGVGALPARASGSDRRPTISIAHLTDTHIQPERRGAEGVAACLAHIMGLAQRPQLILTGGDLIMDGFAEDEARTKMQWDLFTRAFREGTDLPVRHCLGNHDIWGWDKAKSKTTGAEPGWGKAMAIDTLGLPGAYYSFTQGGWKFIVLDSVQPRGNGYIGRLDPDDADPSAEGPQLAWLRGELERTPASVPVCVVTHIPILCAGLMLTDARPNAEGVQISASVQLTDNHRIIDLFSRHANVKLVLQGHIHINDRIDYQGVTYLCNGAVSGAWWRGKEADRADRLARAKPGDPIRPYRSDEGYALIDLFEDGSFAYVYMRYGWVPSEK